MSLYENHGGLAILPTVTNDEMRRDSRLQRPLSSSRRRPVAVATATKAAAVMARHASQRGQVAPLPAVLRKDPKNQYVTRIVSSRFQSFEVYHNRMQADTRRAVDRDCPTIFFYRASFHRTKAKTML